MLAFSNEDDAPERGGQILRKIATDRVNSRYSGKLMLIHLTMNLHLFTFSVMIISTTPFPVSGREQSSKILCFPPFATCSMVTTTFVPALPTKSMAPPIPLTTLP